MVAVAEAMEGQLTATLHLEDGDTELANGLVVVLEEKAGRLLCNGFPTGVEVCSAMMHGGPYPASTDARVTSVGTLAIARWLRPVSYQDFPKALLHPELRIIKGV
jgi:NADP-dependent aldehyde dehydrogenase